jgi:hypothetical protein
MIKGVKKITYISGKIDTNKTSGTRIIAFANEWIVFGIKEWEAGTTETEKLTGVTWLCQSYNRTKIIGKTVTPNGKNFKFKIPKSLCGVYTYYLEASLSGKTDVRQTGLFVTGYCEAKITKAQWIESPHGIAINSPIDYGTTAFIDIKTEGLNGFKSLAVEIYKKEGDKLITTVNSENVIDGVTVVEVKTTFFQILKPTESFYIKVKNPNTGKYVLDGNNNEKHANFLEVKNVFTPPPNPFFPTNTTALKVGKPDANRKDYSKPYSFNITFEIDKKAKTVVPLGILDFENKYENPYFSFKYNLTKGDLDSLNFEILDEDRKVIYQMGYLKPIIVIAHKKPMVLMEVDGAIPKFEPLKPIKYFDIATIFKKFEVKDDDYTKIGEYIIHWDGFDNNEVYDSTIFNDKKLTARIKAVKGIEQKTIEVDFETSYDQVQWVDVKINKKTKRIDTTLRVNLTDGGANGVKCNTYTTEDETSYETFTPSTNQPDPFKDTKVTICDWDKIPTTVIKPNQPIIKTRTKTFEELKKMVLSGLEHYWGRNKTRSVANHVKIKYSYEVFIHALDSNKKALNALPLVYMTNGDWMRSGNPGGSYSDNNLDDDALDALPDLGIIQRLSYNTGYIKHDWDNDKNNGWRYYTDTDNGGYYDAISEFKETAAHEIGHELLQAYGGTVYSWQHKGSSYYLPQDTKPIKGDETMWGKIKHLDEMTETSGEYYPKSPNEIDLMKYYNSNDKNGNFIAGSDSNRLIASEKDVLGLIWLTKIKIR